MKDNSKLIDSLLEKATNYGKTSLELIKLQAVDKTSDSVSSIVPIAIVIIIVSCFLLFINLGIAFWLGDIFGKIYRGFLAVGAFYAIVSLILYFFMRNRIKQTVYDFMIRQLLK